MLGVLLAVAVFTVGLTVGSQFFTQVHAETRLGEWALVIANFLLVAVTLGLVLGANRGSRKQLRAYISIEPEGIGEYLPPDRVLPSVSFHNTGSVFAKHVATSINCELSDDGERKDFDEGAVFGDNVIAPRGRILRGADKAIFKHQIDADRNAAEACNKQLYLYVWGIVRYHDGFTEGRFARYCHRYNFSGLPKGTYSFAPERYR